MTNKFRHVGIVVSDVNTHSKFLTEVLGFTIVSDQIEKGPFISEMLQIDSAEVHTIKFKGISDGIIELLEFQNPKEIDNRNEIIQPNSFGITHVAVTVQSALETYQLSLEKGFFPFSKPLISPKNEVNVFYLRGPDQVLYEIVEERQN